MPDHARSGPLQSDAASVVGSGTAGEVVTRRGLRLAGETCKR